MKKLIILSGMVAISFAPMFGQDAETTASGAVPPQMEMMQPREEVTVYDQVDEIRNRFGLDYKQFDKAYSAYDKFHKAIYGDNSSTQMMGGMPGMGGGPGGGGMGGPGGGGMGGPGGGGMGGPGGGGMGGPGGGGMGGPGGGMGGGMQGGRPNFSSSTRQKAPQPLTEKEIKKRQEKIAKQEAKLEKSMRKVLTDDEQYNEWLEMRQEEMKHLFPAPPQGPKPDGPKPGEPRPEDQNSGETNPAGQVPDGDTPSDVTL